MITKRVILVALLLILFSIGITSASYSRQISINPVTPDNNYQVKITLNATNFNYTNLSFPSTGSDITFKTADGVTPLSYWIESWNNGGTSILWVNVTTAGTSSINMLYGNVSGTASSNGFNTFGLFDDFSSSATIQSSFSSSTLWPGTTYDAWGMTYIDPNNTQQMVYFYRSAPKHDVDDGGKIDRALYNITTNTWSGNGTTVYQSPEVGIDDRQMSGGVINGTVYTFETRYNVTTSKWQDIVIMTTPDNGNTWNKISTISPPGNWSWFQVFGHLVQADNGVWYVPWYGKNSDNGLNYSNLLQSTDNGITWTFGPSMASSLTKQYTETDIANIGSGRMLALIRTDNSGGYLTQSVSSDNGATWTNVGNTSLGDASHQWAASMIFDSQINKIVIMYAYIGATGNTYYISEDDPNVVFSNASAYTTSLISNSANYANNNLITKIAPGKYYLLWSAGFPTSTTVYGGVYNYNPNAAWCVLSGSSPAVSSGMMTIDNDWIRSNTTFGTNYSIRALGKMSATTVKQEIGFSSKATIGSDSDIQNAPNSDSMYMHSSDVVYIDNQNGTGSQQSNGGTYSTTPTIFEIVRNGTTNVIYTHNDTAYTNSPINAYVSTTNMYIHLLDVSNSAGSSQWDWILVRKSSSIEPVMTFGYETTSPIASFTSSNVSNVFTFTDTSTNNAISWLWDFGDGQTSTVQSPTHTYMANGTYTVSLTATNLAGSNQITHSAVVLVISPTAPTVTSTSISSIIPVFGLFGILPIILIVAGLIIGFKRRDYNTTFTMVGISVVIFLIIVVGLVILSAFSGV